MRASSKFVFSSTGCFLKLKMTLCFIFGPIFTIGPSISSQYFAQSDEDTLTIVLKLWATQWASMQKMIFCQDWHFEEISQNTVLQFLSIYAVKPYLALKSTLLMFITAKIEIFKVYWSYIANFVSFTGGYQGTPVDFSKKTAFSIFPDSSCINECTLIWLRIITMKEQNKSIV